MGAEEMVGVAHPITVRCDNCGTELKREPNQVKRNKHNFCNHKCFGDWKSKNWNGEHNPAWRGGAATYYGDPLVYYYYYLYSAAKAYILADAGEAWYDDLVAHLGSIQSAAGSMPATWNESEVLATEWAALALETRAGPPPGVSQELWIVLNSPADLYVTDPLGRHIGADPVTHDPVNEIPDATYSGPGTEPQEIVIPDPVRGTYLIDVLGTATGAYTLSMIGVSGGEQVSQAVATGTIAPGVIDPYDAVVTSVTSPLDIFLSPAEIEFVEATVELHPRSLNLKRCWSLKRKKIWERSVLRLS